MIEEWSVRCLATSNCLVRGLVAISMLYFHSLEPGMPCLSLGIRTLESNISESGRLCSNTNLEAWALPTGLDLGKVVSSMLDSSMESARESAERAIAASSLSSLPVQPCIKLITGETRAWTLLSIPEPKPNRRKSGQECPDSCQEDAILIERVSQSSLTNTESRELIDSSCFLPSLTPLLRFKWSHDVYWRSNGAVARRPIMRCRREPSHASQRCSSL